MLCYVGDQKGTSGLLGPHWQPEAPLLFSGSHFLAWGGPGDRWSPWGSGVAERRGARSAVSSPPLAPRRPQSRGPTPGPGKSRFPQERARSCGPEASRASTQPVFQAALPPAECGEHLPLDGRHPAPGGGPQVRLDHGPHPQHHPADLHRALPAAKPAEGPEEPGTACPRAPAWCHLCAHGCGPASPPLVTRRLAGRRRERDLRSPWSAVK